MKRRARNRPQVNPNRVRTASRTLLPPSGRRLSILDLSRNAPDWVIVETVRADDARERGDVRRAALLYEKVLDRMRAKPWRMLTALYNYGGLCHDRCHHAMAIHCYRQVLQHAPTLAEAWYSLGTVLQESRQSAEAATCLERAIAIAPDLAAAWINLGNARLGLGDMVGAEAAFTEAMRRDPQNALGMWNQAQYLILSGQWRAGWASYEARWSVPGFRAQNTIAVQEGSPTPVPWTGQDLRGKTLVVCGEQGWGDDLMCLRYAAKLRELGATVTWAVRDGLVRLAELAVTPDRVMRLEHDPLPATDYCVTTMSLHHRLGVTVETVPGAEGYLKVAA